MEELFTFDELKEEVYKCSKCALCRSACPPFIDSKDETMLARGKCVVLNAFFSGKMKLKMNFVNKLFCCLDCNKCQTVCPSSINMERVAKSALKLYCEQHPIKKLFLKNRFENK